MLQLSVRKLVKNMTSNRQWHAGRGVWGVKTPPEIPKAFQNRAKLNPIVKTVKNC